MKKILFCIIACVLAITSCVSLKKYETLKLKYHTEHAGRMKNANELKILKNHLMSLVRLSQSTEEALLMDRNVLEREVSKHIRKGMPNISECTKLTGDSSMVYITFCSIDSASSATEVMAKVYKKVQDSIKAACEDVVNEAIRLYSDQTKMPFDSINIDRIYTKIVRYTCNDVWQDSANTYWAVETQRIYWNEYIDEYIANTKENENQFAQLAADFEQPEDSDHIYKKALYGYFLMRANRKLNEDLFIEAMHMAIDNKYKY